MVSAPRAVRGPPPVLLGIVDSRSPSLPYSPPPQIQAPQVKRNPFSDCRNYNYNYFCRADISSSLLTASEFLECYESSKLIGCFSPRASYSSSP